MDKLFKLAAQAHATEILLRKAKENFADCKTGDQVTIYGHMLLEYFKAHQELGLYLIECAKKNGEAISSEFSVFRKAIQETKDLTSEEKREGETVLSFYAGDVMAMGQVQ